MRSIFSRQQKKATLQKEIDNPNIGFFFQNEDKELQLKMINFTMKDLRNIYLLKETVTAHIDTVVEAFYCTITEVPQLLEIINTHSSVDRLRNTLKQHLLEMFEGRIDDQFIEKRKRVALVHLRIGLYPKWYVAAFQNLQQSLAQLIIGLNLDIEEERALILSVSKMLNFEQQIVLEEFDKAVEKELNQHQEEIKMMVQRDIGSISAEIEQKSVESIALVEQLMAQTEKLNKNVQESIEHSQSTKEISQIGMDQFDKFAQMSRTIEAETNQVAEMVTGLNHSAQEIHAVIQIVNDIAEQTNLLALNSAIEAARAGEHGLGFAVVAEEVRKLADQTKQSVSQISNLIEQSSEVTANVVQAIQHMQDLIHTGIGESERSIVSFKSITSSIEVTIHDIQDFAKQMNQLMSAVETIGRSTEEVLRTSKNLEQAISVL